ncbi:MAG: AraC family transcriptional regulator [Bacilli bacterium]
MYEFRYYENIRHGSPNFPFQIYKIEHTKDAQQILPIHWHDEMEIIFLDKGRAVFRIEDRDFPLHAGEALIVHPGELHSAYNDESTEEITYYAIVFKLSWITSAHADQTSVHELTSLITQAERFPSNLTIIDNIHILLLSRVRHILQKYEFKHTGYELGLKGLLLLLFSDVYQYGLVEKGKVSKNNQRTEARALIKKVLSYMETHSREKIELDQLASVIHLSRSHFCRFFKTQTGMRPLEYLNFIRINNAASMLRNGNYTVLEAAVESGFYHPSYFTKWFKKIHHMTPSKYKALYSSGI